MRVWRLLMQREIEELWRRKAYWITTVVLVMGISAVFVVMPWFQHHVTTARWNVETASPVQTSVIKRALQQSAHIAHFHIQWVSAASASVVVHVINHSSFAQHLVVKILHNPGPTSGWITHALMPAILSARLAGLPHGSLIHSLMKTPTVVIHRALHVTAPAPSGQVAITSSLAMIIFLVLSIYGQMLLQSVAAEKASRLSELLSVRIHPATLLWGKWAGVGTAAALQVATAVLTGWGFMQWDPGAHTLIQQWHVHAAPALLWGAAIVGFVAGFGIYGALFMVVGASLSRPEDARSAMGIPTMALLLGYGVMMYGLIHPTGIWVHWLADVPPFFPFLIVVLQGLGTATWSTWLVGGLITTAAVIGLLKFAGWRYHRALYHR